jgi:hypothetical protein
MSTIKVDTIATRSGSGSVTVSNNIALATEGNIDINSTNLLVRSTGNKSGLRFDTSAYTPFKNNAVADGTVDLGYASGKFKDLFLGGGIYLGGTTAVNHLDDYEEGTWTPTLRDIGGNEASAYGARAGFYIKIGQFVFVNFRFTLTNKGSITGNYTMIGGLPINNAGSDGGSGVINRYTNLASGVSSLGIEIGGGSVGVGWVTQMSGTSGTSDGYMGTSQINNNTFMQGSMYYRTG